MPGRAPEALQSDVDRWLTNLGFSRGNPFASAEADQERALLPEFFVDVDGYEHIKADHPIIVFAPRGGGKSALRIVLASQAISGALEATILAVEYSDFDELIARRHSGHDLTIDDFVPRLLRAGVKSLLEILCGVVVSERPGAEAARNQRYRAARVAALLPSTRSRLQQALRSYHPSLLNPIALYERLHALDPAFAPDWNAFVAAIDGRYLREMIAAGLISADERAHLLADLNDYPDISGDTAASPTEHMAAFVDLARAVGLTSIHFLVDRLDEHLQTANDWCMQADILEPLLAHLQVLELPGVAFKFFLSQEVRDILLDRKTIRRDRLIDHAVTMKWDEKRLRQLLRLRLSVYSGGQISDLVQICRETRVEVGRERLPCLLGTWIEDELVEAAQGSPRRLLVGGQLLCQAHVRYNGPTGLVESRDWEAAKKELARKMPLLLRLFGDAPVVRAGDRAIKLTPLEHRILKALMQSPNLCDRNTLAETAWGMRDGVSDQAMDKAIERLREKLGDDQDDPIYLKTKRNEGFKLVNYAIE